MEHHEHEDLDFADVRKVLCAIFCSCRKHRKKRAKVTLKFGVSSITFIYTEGDSLMATVKDDGGPFKADISNFVDDKGNPVTDADVPVFSSSDPTVATVTVDDPALPQEATVTLTGKLSDPATPCVITADFNGGDANKVNGGFSVVGQLNVIASAAVSAQMVFSGPGIVPGA